MNSLGVHETQKIFESKPKESAAWLVSFDCIAALYSATKSYKAVQHPPEVAAKGLISTIGNGDFRTTNRFFTDPESHSYGMKTLVQNLGALSTRGRIDPALVAAISFKEDKLIQRDIPLELPVFELYKGAESFPKHFADLARQRFRGTSTGSLADAVYSIRNDTLYWIDQ